MPESPLLDLAAEPDLRARLSEPVCSTSVRAVTTGAQVLAGVLALAALVELGGPFARLLLSLLLGH